MNPMWVDIDTSESPLIIIYLRPSPSRCLGTEEKLWCNFFSFNSQQRYSQLYVLSNIFFSIRCIASSTREKKRGYIIFFWVCNVSLLVMFPLLFLKDLEGICIYLRLLTFLLFAFFTRLLLTFVLFFLFYLLAVVHVPRSG